MKASHVVKAHLKAYANRDNQIYIDDKEIKNVVAFSCDVGLGRAGHVTITFHADVELELEGAGGGVATVGATSDG